MWLMAKLFYELRVSPVSLNFPRVLDCDLEHRLVRSSKPAPFLLVGALSLSLSLTVWNSNFLLE